MRNVEIHKIEIKGFKSIHALTMNISSPINVFVGQNGAGKSNFLGFFRFLSNMIGGTGNLQDYVGRSGGASVFLFDGLEITPQLSGYINLRIREGFNEYKFSLSHASGDTFIYTGEQFRFNANDRSGTQRWYDLGSGHKESALIGSKATGKTQQVITKMLRQLITYQFHNTSFSSLIRNNKSEVENS